jgi:hypothetical protein
MGQREKVAIWREGEGREGGTETIPEIRGGRTRQKEQDQARERQKEQVTG